MDRDSHRELIWGWVIAVTTTALLSGMAVMITEMRGLDVRLRASHVDLSARQDNLQHRMVTRQDNLSARVDGIQRDLAQGLHELDVDMRHLTSRVDGLELWSGNE